MYLRITYILGKIVRPISYFQPEAKENFTQTSCGTKEVLLSMLLSLVIIRLQGQWIQGLNNVVVDLGFPVLSSLDTVTRLASSESWFHSWARDGCSQQHCFLLVGGISSPGSTKQSPSHVSFTDSHRRRPTHPCPNTWPWWWNQHDCWGSQSQHPLHMVWREFRSGAFHSISGYIHLNVKMLQYSLVQVPNLGNWSNSHETCLMDIWETYNLPGQHKVALMTETLYWVKIIC